MSMSMSRVRDLAAPMHLGPMNCPFVPHVQSKGPRSITEAPVGPQAFVLNILRLQEKGAQMCLSEWGQGQGLTFTKNMCRGFLHHPTLPAQWTILKANWIGHILPRNCLLQRVTERKIQGGIEVTGRQGRRHRKLLDDLKERRGYSHLKEEPLDCTMWRTRFGRDFGPVVRQTTKWMDCPAVLKGRDAASGCYDQ